MEIVTSCEIETKFKCKIYLNIHDIDKNYEMIDNNFQLKKQYNFAMNFKNGTQFTAVVFFSHIENKDKIFHVAIDYKVFDFEDCKVSFAINFNGNEIIMDLSTQGAGEGVDLAQKLTQPKHAFSGAE